MSNTNKIGQSVVMQSQAGHICDANCEVFVLALTRALVGSLSIKGIKNSDGSSAAWTLDAGTTAGAYSPPGAGHTGGAGLLSYALSDPSDMGAAVIAFRTR